MADVTAAALTDAAIDRIEHKQHDAAVLADTAKNTGYNRVLAACGVLTIILALLVWLVYAAVDHTMIVDRMSVVDHDITSMHATISYHDKSISDLKMTAAKTELTLSGMKEEYHKHDRKLDDIIGMLSGRHQTLMKAN